MKNLLAKAGWIGWIFIGSAFTQSAGKLDANQLSTIKESWLNLGWSTSRRMLFGSAGPIATLSTFQLPGGNVCSELNFFCDRDSNRSSSFPHMTSPVTEIKFAEVGLPILK